MKARASSTGISTCSERPKAERPYMMPKLVALARSRCWRVTCSGGMPATAAAVLRWTSSPRRKASSSAGSSANWAMRRSSICE